MKLVYCFIFSLYFVSCTKVFYQPDRVRYPLPKQNELRYEDVFFTSKDKTKLHGVWLKSNQSKATVLIYHGNAQNLSSHIHLTHWLFEQGYDLFVFDYRGYGQSHGKAKPKGVHDDAISALEYVLANTNQSIIIYGQSLGSAISLKALCGFKQHDRILSIIIEGGFVSYQSIANQKLASVWFLWPFSWLSHVLVSDQYALKDFSNCPNKPLFVMHSTKDPIVPFKLGEEIFDRYPSSMKKSLWIDEKGHTNLMHLDRQRFRTSLLEFLHALIKP